MAKNNVQRLTDVNDAGGAITSIPQNFIFENSLLVGVDGSIGTGHPPCPTPAIHCSGNWQTSQGAEFVKINGIPVNRKGDSDTCGHSRIAGSDFVFIVD